MVRNRDVVISKADKGDVTVVMSVAHYLELAYKHLGDESTYRVLNSDPTSELAKRFNSYCRRVPGKENNHG